MAITKATSSAVLGRQQGDKTHDAVPSILVVGNDRDGTALRARALDRAGYIVEVAHSGPEALERLACHRFDILLSDVRMPRLSGDELQRIARERDPDLAVILITTSAGSNDAQLAVECLKQGVLDFVVQPSDLSDVVNRVEAARLRRREQRREREQRLHLERRAFEQTEQLERALNGSATALIRLLEAKDRTTFEHSRRVSELAEALARRVASSDSAFIARVRVAGFLHDIGKVGVPDAILRKGGALDDGEKETVRLHPVTGADILAPVFDAATVAMVRGHHEQIDGRGYPDGLSGSAIPLGAKIIAVADAYDALTYERPYKSKMTQESALNILIGGADRHWEESVVDAIVEMAIEEKVVSHFPHATSIGTALSVSAEFGDLHGLYSSTGASSSSSHPPVRPPALPRSDRVICAKGAIGGGTLPAIQAAFEARLGQGLTEIILDISRCDQITTEGAQRIHEMGQRARSFGGQLVVRDAAPRVWRVFEDAGLASALRFEHSEKV
jgi:response regulator RpfG family c-di-GMP phosphodiesterase